MIFIPLLILGIILYFTDKRVLSVLIFFFFFTNGFQLTPIGLFDTGSIITKSLDFAVLYIGGISVIGLIKYPDFIVKNKITAWIFIFLAFVLVLIYISKQIIGVEWGEIIRTSRNFSFVLAFFVFRRLTVKETKTIIDILFRITFFLCFLYVVQAFIGRPLLTGEEKTGYFGKITRYYNIPILYFFFLYIALLANPFKGFWKYTSIAIFILVCIVSLHRGLMISIFLLTFLGIFLQGGFKGVIKYVFLGGLILVPFMERLAERFEDKTSKDIQSVMQGAFEDYGEEISLDGTFLFRIAHFYERFEYVTESPMQTAFGVGLMAEGSPMTTNMFEFKIGLHNEDQEVVQLDTSDIAWSNFIIRLGFVGTIIYLFLYFVIGKFLYNHRKKHEMALISFLYILLLLLNSLTSFMLYNTEMMVPVLLVVAFVLKSDEEEENIIELHNDTQNNNNNISL